MPIKNLSEVRRLPRLGKIHLGLKKTSEKSGKEYPVEVDYFVVPDGLKAALGDKPKELRIMFPLNNTEDFFPQWYKCYGATALKCKGDGVKAFTWDEDNGGLKETDCPCPKLEASECKQIGILQFMMPGIPGVGVWQITTSSKNSIINLNSSIDFVRAICGRVNMIPLVLKREKTEMTRTEDGKQKKSTHYTMKVDVDENVTMRQLQQAAQKRPEMVLLPPPDESKDDLFYPPNGFKPEEKGVTEDKYVHGAKAGASTIDDLPGGEGGAGVSDETKRIAALHDELTGLIAQCEGGGKKLTREAWDQVHALKEEAEYKKAIETFKGRLGKKSAKKDGEFF